MSARLLVGVLLVLAAVWVLPAPAYACSCAGGSDVEHAARADVVFTGTVIDDQQDERAVQTVTFAVERVFKGEAEAVQIVVNPMGGMCGFETSGSGPLVVFADRDQSTLTSNLCSGTRFGSAPAGLGTGQPPDGVPGSDRRPDAAPPANRGTGVPLVALILAASAAAVVGLSLVRRRVR